MKLKDGTMRNILRNQRFDSVLYCEAYMVIRNTNESGRKAKKPWVWESGCGYWQNNQDVQWRNW